MAWFATSFLTTVSASLLLLLNQTVADGRPAPAGTSKQYSIADPAQVPLIVVAKALRAGRVTASEPFQPPRADAQLWSARIQIENVLQGDAKGGDAEVFYFLLAGGVRPLLLHPGERNVFFLMRDHGELRTICDVNRTCCMIPVLTGAHPNFQQTPGASIEQTISQLLFSRGSGSSDRDLVEALEKEAHRLPFKEAVTVKTLQFVETHSSPLVGEAACYALRARAVACADPPGSQLHDHATCSVTRRGDGFQIAINGSANEPVYRSFAEANRTSLTRMGTTDAHGHFAMRETHEQSAALLTEVWSVGSAIASPAVTYVRGRADLTSLGGERDRYGISLSSQAITNGYVTAYAAAQLSYPASLYYDVGIASRTFQEQDVVKHEQASNIGFASVLTVIDPLVWMDDYVTEAKAYAKPAISTQGEFLNPLRFEEGSCFGSSASCQIVPLGAPDRLKDPQISLGATRND